MNVLLTLRVALRALAKNKMRASLTVLGVVIGIAAVTTMVSIGQSATKLVQLELEGFGTNAIFVLPANHRRGGVRQGNVNTLTASDSDSIAVECPSVLASSPLVGASGQVIYGNNNWQPKEMFGVGVDYLVVRNWNLHSGGFFTKRDVATSAKVCVIGRTIVARLFQTTNPIGALVRIRNIPFRVVGVLEHKGSNMIGDDQDNIILLPHTTVRKRLYGSRFNDVHAIMVSAKSATRIPLCKKEITQLLLDRHRINKKKKPDFEVQTSTEIADMLGMVTGTLTLMIASIAGISLIVGGVGIMNIMLVSVTERTREIGIRMAVGARSGDILRQFLIEAVFLSSIGGLVGFILGLGASAGITTLINTFTNGTKWPIVISIPAAIIAILFAAAVGIFFGFYPAKRASKLDPIDALRYE